ncbi:MAG: D-Ala-D-Ala carboxypeptidase family metallohydrolase [Nitrospinota bacterium]|nr:D-Ala-D-Ala carboxypeptidase family metallohydrolase [Nitrospinota bacterium]
MSHFKMEEFACPCCGENKISPELVEKLEEVRVMYYRRPLVVSSGYRCDKHEAEVGGTGANHPKGLAGDLVAPGNRKIIGQNLLDLIMGLVEQGVTRIVLYRDERHIHVDINQNLPQGIFIK